MDDSPIFVRVEKCSAYFTFIAEEKLLNNAENK